MNAAGEAQHLEMIVLIQVVGITMLQIIVVVQEQYVHGMLQIHHVKHGHPAEQKREIGDYLLLTR